MTLADLLHTSWWPGILVATVFLIYAGHWLSEGIWVRWKFRQLKAMGIPIMPHSLLFGHLALVGKLYKQANAPPDLHSNFLPLLVARNWRTLFPTETKCPPVFYIDVWPMGPPMILPVDPGVAIQLITHPKLPKARATASWLRPITQNLDMVSAEGWQWRIWRTRFSAGFSAKNVTALAPAIIDEVATFAENVKSKTGTDRGKWGDVFPLEEMATNLTIDVIGRAALDMELRAQRDGPPELQTALIDQMNLTMMWINIFNVWRFLNPVRHFRMLRNHRTMRRFLLPNLLRRLDAVQREGSTTSTSGRYSTGRTIVDMAIEAYTAEAKEAGKGKGREEAKFDDPFLDTIMAQLKVFMFAGHDTTATTICWMLHGLADNPDAMARLRKEHDEILGSKDGLTQRIRQTPQILNSLPWTTAVIKETLRMYPVVGSIRDGRRDVFFSVPGSSVPWPTVGPEFFVCDGILPNMYSDDVWPQPDKFMPERWMTNDPDDPLHPLKNAWRPFGAGPRNCIGQELAMMELRLVLVLLAREVDIECAWDQWDQWDEWDEKMESKDKPTFDGHRCYPYGTGGLPHVKGGMPVHVRSVV